MLRVACGLCGPPSAKGTEIQTQSPPTIPNSPPPPHPQVTPPPCLRILREGSPRRHWMEPRKRSGTWQHGEGTASGGARCWLGGTLGAQLGVVAPTPHPPPQKKRRTKKEAQAVPSLRLASLKSRGPPTFFIHWPCGGGSARLCMVVLVRMLEPRSFRSSRATSKLASQLNFFPGGAIK